MRRPRAPGLSWGRDHPVAVDVVPVLALAVLTLLPLLRIPASTAGDVVVSLVVWLPALVRRQHPEVAFVATALVVFTSWAAQGFGTPDLLPAYVALWLALCAVADRCDAPRALAAAAVCEVGAVISLFSEQTEPGGTAFVPLTAITVAAAVIGRNMRTRRAYTASLEDRAARLEREQDQSARVAVAEERARIAREVHDVVAHNISVMIALADGATYVTTEPRARAAISQVAVTGRQALTEMSALLGVLRDDDGAPDRRPPPGLADLELLVDQVRAAGLATDLVVRGAAVPLSATAQLAVYRLVQEALTNTLKHGRDVRRARVELRWEPGTLGIEVTDDGEPVPPPAPSTVGGHGIPGMRERLVAWSGSVSAGPARDRGWRVDARLPLAAAGDLTLGPPVSGPHPADGSGATVPV